MSRCGSNASGYARTHVPPSLAQTRVIYLPLPRLLRACACLVVCAVPEQTDGSGWISISELNGALRRCGMYVGDDQLRKMFDDADLDRSGGIDLDEFEALAQRLVTPSRLLGAPGAASLPPPSAGSAVDAVFAAFTKGTTGLVTVRELPKALQLLGVDADDPQVAREIEIANKASRGVLGRHAFSVLVHRLLRRDFTPAISKAAAPIADAPAAAVSAETAGRRSKPKSKSSKAAETAAAPAAAGTGDARRRLARAFALCESHESGTIAARDVPGVLFRAEIVTDRSLLPSLRPKPEHAMTRVAFERLEALAFGSLSMESTPEAASPLPTFTLHAIDVTLEPWVVAHPAVHDVCVIVRGGLGGTQSAPGESTSSSDAPLISLRSPAARKQVSPHPSLPHQDARQPCISIRCSATSLSQRVSVARARARAGRAHCGRSRGRLPVRDNVRTL